MPALESGERRGFTITKFERHEDGYFHARVTPRDGNPVYVHRRFGSWLAPGTLRGRVVLREVQYDVKVALQQKARAVERQERLESALPGEDEPTLGQQLEEALDNEQED